MITNSLSFQQIRLAQKLLQYYFQINYYQEKTNTTVDILFCFS